MMRTSHPCRGIGRARQVPILADLLAAELRLALTAQEHVDRMLAFHGRGQDDIDRAAERAEWQDGELHLRRHSRVESTVTRPVPTGSSFSSIRREAHASAMRPRGDGLRPEPRCCFQKRCFAR